VCQACSRLEQKHGKKSSSLPRPHALSVNAGKKSRSFLSYLMTTDNWGWRFPKFQATSPLRISFLQVKSKDKVKNTFNDHNLAKIIFTTLFVFVFSRKLVGRPVLVFTTPTQQQRLVPWALTQQQLDLLR